MTDPTYSSPDELNSTILDRIAALLSGVEWEVSYLDDIAELVRFTGREIADSGDEDHDADLSVSQVHELEEIGMAGDARWESTFTRPPQVLPPPPADDKQYLTLNVPRYPYLDTPMLVNVKLDDEGVVIDILQGGEVVASTWKLYSDFGITVTRP